jgi:hypothetical protein
LVVMHRRRVVVVVVGMVDVVNGKREASAERVYRRAVGRVRAVNGVVAAGHRRGKDLHNCRYMD